MANIEPSHASEEQPERLYCRHCGGIIYVLADGSIHSGFVDHIHQAERRRTENAGKRKAWDKDNDEILLDSDDLDCWRDDGCDNWDH